MKYETEMRFPAVTVCNHNPILKSRLSQGPIKDAIYGTDSTSSDEASEEAAITAVPEVTGG